MTNNPKFSIIIPSYNRAEFLPRAINSVLEQSYSNWELWIIDDGSTDNTREVVAAFTDKRINYIYQANAERSAARNNGIKQAIGNFICFMDSDNYMLKNRLELLLESISKYNFCTAMYYTGICYECPDTLKKYVKKEEPFTFPINYDELMRTVIATPQLCCSAEILKKHRFNPELTIGEDMELLFRIAVEYPLLYLENNATITEIEHPNRSVAHRSAASLKQLKTLKVMFWGTHPANKVSRKEKRLVYSTVYFNIAKDWFAERRLKGLFYLCKSIVKAPFSKQTKYKLNLLFAFCFRAKSKIKSLLEYSYYK
jgi:glycosyltransferase involved in cell wall biosynthesis